MLALALPLWLAATTPPPPRTLRVDCLHSGSASAETFIAESVVLEGAWSGHPDHDIDDSGRGPYMFEVRDVRDGDLLFSQGYASLFGEWRTTAEARSVTRTFHESLRFPAPGRPVELLVKGRAPGGEWVPLWRTSLDPAVARVASPRARFSALQESGPAQEKLDLAILGDGYTRAEMPKFRQDARRLTSVLLSLPPFRERRGDINVWLVETPASESGISRPRDGVARQSPLRTTYDALGMERYVLTFDNKRLRDSAAAVPYDALVILVNERLYGGGGIFRLYATCAAGSTYAPYVFVHELGHVLGGLADEYYLSGVSYETGAQRPEPWEPNVTADPRARRWADLITVGTPLPTPWPKARYEALISEMHARREELRKASASDDQIEALFRLEQERTDELLTAAEHARKVGAFEGAMYVGRGYYRPAINCIMFSRTTSGFCPVCRRALERAIDHYSRPRAPAGRPTRQPECPRVGAGVE